MHDFLGDYAARGAGGDQQVHEGSHPHIRLVRIILILVLVCLLITPTLIHIPMCVYMFIWCKCIHIAYVYTKA